MNKRRKKERKKKKKNEIERKKESNGLRFKRVVLYSGCYGD